MHRQLLLLLLVSGLAAGFSPITSAVTAQRTFVASAGVDNPACSISSPCRSFDAAITATSAGGEVIVLDSAGYGPVSITKSASVVAPPGVYAGVSVFTGSGITVNGPNVLVVLRGLAINGLGGDTGIDIQDARRVRIENCVVSGMMGAGIFHRAFNAEVSVRDSIVRHNVNAGIKMVNASGSITLERVTIEGNTGDGLYISPNVATGKLDATISDSTFTRNGGYGVFADAGASATVIASIDRSTLTANTIGVYAKGSSSAVLRVAVQRSTLRRNVEGINATASAPASIVVNASDNVLHENLARGMSASGSGAIVRASGNSYDDIVCQSGGSVVTYHTNSAGLVGACVTSAVLQ